MLRLLPGSPATLLLGLGLLTTAPLAAAPGPHWTDEFTDSAFDGPVLEAGVWQGQPVIAGDYTALGARRLGSPAVLVGDRWETLGEGVNGRVHAIRDDGGDLWIGGDFTRAGNVDARSIARWDGTWHAAGEGLDGIVHEIIRWEDGILAVGEFPATGVHGTANIAFWNGEVWDGFENAQLADGPVFTAIVYEGRLYVGGEFSTYGKGIAVWTGFAWYSPVPWFLSACGGAVPSVRDMELHVGRLYFVGSFRAPRHSARGIAAFEIGESEYRAVGTHFDECDEAITDLDMFNGHVWVASDLGVSNLRTEGWVDVDVGPHDSVHSIAGVGGKLFVAGEWQHASGLQFGEVTSLNLADEWSYARPRRALGFDDAVRCLVDWNGVPTAGGSFTTAGETPVAHLARWTGGSWQPLGVGLNGIVYSLALHGGELVAGGAFNGSGPTTLARRVARWNGGAWEAIGAGFGNGHVSKLVSRGGELLTIGTYTESAGLPLQGVAAWDGNAWAGKGSPIQGASDLEAVGGELLVAGDIDLPDGGEWLGRWNGTDWEAFPGAANGPVRALGEFRGDLVIGGSFLEIGGGPARRVARWDGNQWWPLGGGANNTVFRFAEFGGMLFAAGDFSEMDGQPASRVARWNGDAWLPLDEGVVGGALALLPVGGRLWIAGTFNVAGGRPVERIASWTQPISVPAPSLALKSAQPDGPVPAVAPPILLRAWPNPAPADRDQSLEFSLPARADVTLTVHDVTGRLARTVTARDLAEGHHSVRWDGRDDAGRRAAAGVYFVRLAAAGESVTHKIVRVD